MSDMSDGELEWIEKYIRLNQGREGRKMLLNDSNEERCDSVVMDCTPFSVKVALNCGSYVAIRRLCVLEGNNSYHIDKNYFNMSKFDLA